MSTDARRRGGDPDGRHFDRIYARLDQLSARVGKLERILWIGTGGLGGLATFNLIANISQIAAGQ